jgi:3-methyladenine DNA glycosylase Mpg
MALGEARAVDVKQVGRELGVRYVLEGSVRKAGSRVRIAGQLVDAATGIHIWADRFEGALEDIFDLQDQVTANVVGAIAPRLEQAEIERSKRKPTESLDAYDYYLRGMAGVHRWTRDATDEALRMFYRAIELDPEYASAYGMAARCYCMRKGMAWVTDRTHEMAEAARLALRAADLGKNDAVALCTAGFALTFVVGRLDDGVALIDRALVLRAGVLLRALEPLDGIDLMVLRRGTSRLCDLARGPGRLAEALAIDRHCDGIDLCAAGELWLAAAPWGPGPIGRSVRIGITREVGRPWRFYERGSSAVSGPRRLRA